MVCVLTSIDQVSPSGNDEESINDKPTYTTPPTLCVNNPAASDSYPNAKDQHVAKVQQKPPQEHKIQKVAQQMSQMPPQILQIQKMTSCTAYATAHPTASSSPLTHYPNSVPLTHYPQEETYHEHTLVPPTYQEPPWTIVKAKRNHFYN